MSTPTCDAAYADEVARAKQAVRDERSERVRRFGVALVVAGVTIFGGIAGNAACNNPSVGPQVANAIPAAAACAIDVIEDVTVAIDIAKTAATCGLLVQDVIAIVSSLLDNMPEAGAAQAAKQGVSPSAYEAHLRAWLAAAEAAKAGGAK